MATAYGYERRWCCRNCGSTDLSIAVQWGESVEPVDQNDDTLSPANAGPGDVARILVGFCNACHAEARAGDGFERRRVRVR